MPVSIRWLAYLNPLRYFLIIVRGIFLKGVGTAVLWPQMLVLLAMGIVALRTASGRFHKTLS
jgi:ABC-2 type transport system permease protein